MIKSIFIITIYCLTQWQLAQAEVIMNDIALEQYKNFDKTWKLVTVTYRKDNNELRFVYANPIAQSALEKGVKSYPNGSVFAKIAYLAVQDPAFETSMGPSQQRRIQFMVRDNTKYRAHRGWGYALFDSQGKIQPEPIHEQINACSSCHDLVPERDYVFSRSMTQESKEPEQIFKFELKEIELNKVSDNARKYIPKEYSRILVASHHLIKNVFQGTLDEIKPIMAKAAVKNKRPVIFYGENESKFLLIYPEDKKIECTEGMASGLFVVSINTLPDEKVNTVHFCQTY